MQELLGARQDPAVKTTNSEVSYDTVQSNEMDVLSRGGLRFEKQDR